MSGDHNGADFISYALKHFPQQFRFHVVGGERIKNLNHPDVKVIADHITESSIGIAEGLRYVYSTITFFSWFKRYLKSNPIDLLFCIDGQGRNLILGKIAKKLGIKTAYYFPPHVSIIGGWNVKKMKWFDLVLNPFLNDHLLYDGYKKSNHKSVYVGHPFQNFFASDYTPVPIDRSIDNTVLGNSKPIVGIFPGSRYQEIKTMTPIFLKAVKKLQKLFPGYEWLISLSHENFRGFIEAEIRRQGVEVEIIHDRSEAIMNTSRFIMACSGTTTLKSSFFGVPHFIAYKISWPTYFIVRMLIYTSFIGMVNIAENRAVVNEFINHHLSTEALVEDTARYLTDDVLREKKSRELITLCKKYFCNSEEVNPYVLIWEHIRELFSATTNNKDRDSYPK